MTTTKPTLGRCVLAGLVAAFAAALLANLTSFILSRRLGQDLDPLHWYTVSRVAAICSIAAAFLYFGLTRWTGRPFLWFTIIVMATAASVATWVVTHPPEPGVARVLVPTHFVLALTIISLIPPLAAAIHEPRRNGSPPRSVPPPIPTPSK